MTTPIDPSRIELLLAQCDREDTNPDTSRRFLYTSEIRHLLGVGPGPSYSELEKLVNGETVEHAACLTLPAWDDVTETVDDLPVTLGEKLRTIYHSTPPHIVENGPSKHAGLRAVYDYIQSLLVDSEEQILAVEHSRIEQLLHARIETVTYGTNWDQDHGYKQGLADALGLIRHTPADGEPDDRPIYPAPGGEIPGQPGYVVGTCGHRLADSEWRAGFRTCERCPTGRTA